MKKSAKFSKALSLLIAVVMLMGVISAGMIAGAADYASWEDVGVNQGNGLQVGDTVIVDGIKYQVKDNCWWITTPPPDDRYYNVVGSVSNVTIKDGAGNAVTAPVNVGVEEGSVFFTAESNKAPIKWSITNNTCGATLNDNYNGGALVSFSKVGSVTLVATDSDNGTAQVVINVTNATIMLNASTVEGAIANGSTLTIEKGQAIDVLVDCTDPSKLEVTQSGNAVTVSRGTTGVPVTILGANVGSSQITLDLYGKTLTFTVKVNEATSANFLANGSPIVGLTTVDVNTTVKVTCSLSVTSWAVTGGDTSVITVAKNSDGSANVTGKTVGGLATVTAYGANNAVLGTFDVYVTESGSSGGYYMNILDSNRADVTSASLNVNESKQFIADCTIVAGSTNVVWELTNVSPAGCVTLTTGGNDGNGNPMATVTAKAEGTAVLKATANGKTDSITINVGGGVIETGKEIVMKFDATKAYVDGSVYPTTQYATGYATLTNVNGTAMMPLRYIAEVSGFDVAYDEATQKTKVTNKANGEYLLVTPGSNAVSKYSSTGALLGTTNAPSAFTINNGVTMGPLRYTCESLGMFVNYQETGHGIYVTVTSTAVSASDALALIEKAYGLGL